MVVIDLVPLVAALLAFVVCWMLLTAYKSTLGYMLGVIANAIDVSILGQHPFSFIAKGIKGFDSAINQALGQAMIGTEWAFGKVMHAQAVLWHDTTSAIADLAETTERALVHLPRAITQTIIPAWVYPLRTTVNFLQKLLARVEHEVATLPRTITRVVTPPIAKAKADVIKVTHVTIKAATFAIPGIYAPAIPRVPAIERTLHGIDEKLRDALKKVSPLALAGAVVIALGRLGLGQLRCRNVTKYAKDFCGIAPKVLEDLLLGLTAIFGTLSLVSLAEQMRGLVSELEGEITHFWRVDKALPSSDRKLGQTGL